MSCEEPRFLLTWRSQNQTSRIHHGDTEFTEKSTEASRMVRVFGSWPALRDHRQKAMVVSGGGPAASRVALATAADPKTRIPFDGTRTSPWKLRVPRVSVVSHAKTAQDLEAKELNLNLGQTHGSWSLQG